MALQQQPNAHIISNTNMDAVVIQSGHTQQAQPQLAICCNGGHSYEFSRSGGVGTGVTQIIIASLCVIAGIVAYAVNSINYAAFGIWSGVLFFLPTGILGVTTARLETGTIMAYMVMCIITSFESFGMIWYEAFYAMGHFAANPSVPVVIIHAVLAVLAFAEFIVSFIGAIYCCMGVHCWAPPYDNNVVFNQSQSRSQPQFQHQIQNPSHLVVQVP